MSNKKIIPVTVGLEKAEYVNRDAITQGDVDAYVLKIRLTGYENLTGRAELRFVLPDMQYADREGTISEGNLITCEMDAPLYSQMGDLVCQVRLLDNNLFTPLFIIFKGIRPTVGDVEVDTDVQPYPEWAGEILDRLDAGTAVAIGPKGDTGDVWKPTVSAGGDISWAKDSGATPPTVQNIKGQKGDTGDTWKPTVSAGGDLTWTKDSGATTPTARNLTGPKGDTGKGVKSTEIKYAVSASGTTIPTTWDSAVQLPEQGKFLWSRTVITYTDDTTSTMYATGYHGEKGDTGAVGPPLNVKGELQSENNLPPSNNSSGDAYVIAGHLWVWTGSAWIDIGDLQGPEGESGFTWRPSVSAAGLLTWTKSSSETVPSSQNIKGPKGDPGTPGSDANITAQSIAAALTYTPANAATLSGHMANYEDPHEYLDEADTGDYAGVRYIFTMIDGEPFMKVVAV